MNRSHCISVKRGILAPILADVSLVMERNSLPALFYRASPTHILSLAATIASLMSTLCAKHTAFCITLAPFASIASGAIPRYVITTFCGRFCFLWGCCLPPSVTPVSSGTDGDSRSDLLCYTTYRSRSRLVVARHGIFYPRFALSVTFHAQLARMGRPQVRSLWIGRARVPTHFAPFFLTGLPVYY